jgi:polyadenylate-binding protein 2
VFVKNVHFSATPDELRAHFEECGKIERITIPVDKMTQKAKGYASHPNYKKLTISYAYIEFQSKEAANRAKLLSDSLFKGR